MSKLVFDIGGTNMRLAIAEAGVLMGAEKFPTPENPTEAVAILRKYLANQETRQEEAIGGIAGIVRGTVIQDSPNLPGWNGFDMGTAFEVPLRLYNDADIAGLGEALNGAGLGHRLVAYIAIGTGVGGTLIIDRAIVRHASGIEPGRHVLDYEKGRTFEDFVGGAALSKEFGKPADHLPQQVYDERTKLFATGLYNALCHWSPDVLVLNGALVSEGVGFRLEAVQTALAEVAKGRPVPPLVRARLGDESGLYGAALID